MQTTDDALLHPWKRDTYFSCT